MDRAHEKKERINVQRFIVLLAGGRGRIGRWSILIIHREKLAIKVGAR